MSESQVDQKWEDFLTPETLRGKLISGALYLAAFQMLKDSIIDRIKSFYTCGFDEKGELVDPKYRSKVLSRNPSALYASLSWLVENGAMGQEDLAAFEKLKDCRNRIAHNMAQLVLADTEFEHLSLFPSLVALLKKVETWWIVNVEIPINEDLNGVEIDEEGIIPGPVITVKLLLEIALGSETDATAYLKAFRKHRSSHTTEN